MEAFIRNLYELVAHCDFGTQRDEQIRDRIVIGILDKSLSQKLQMKSDLNLDSTTQMARQSEQVKFQVAGQSDTKHLGEVHQKKGKPHSVRRPVGNMSDKKPKNSPLFNHAQGAIMCINKMRSAQREGKDVRNITNLVILLLFVVP